MSQIDSTLRVNFEINWIFNFQIDSILRVNFHFDSILRVNFHFDSILRVNFQIDVIFENQFQIDPQISSQFGLNILQLLGIPGRILVPTMTQLFRSS